MIGVAVHVGHTIVVLRNGLGELGALADEGVVVNDVHNNGDTAVMQRLNQHLELFDTGVAVVGVGRIGALGNVEVLGIVAPVTSDLIICLVDGSKVLDGHELYAVDVVLYEVVYAGCNSAFAVYGGVALCEREVLTAVGFANAGGNVDGEITNVDLPYDSLSGVVEQNVTVAVPAVGVGRIEVYDHRAVAVGAYSLGIGVDSLVRSTVAVYDIGVILVFEVAGLRERPDTCRAVIGHRGCTQSSRAGLGVGTCSIELDHYRAGFGSPYLKGSGGRRIYSAEVILVGGLPCVILQILLVCIAGGREVRVGSRCRYGEQRRQHKHSQNYGDKPTNFHVILSFEKNTYYGTDRLFQLKIL